MKTKLILSGFILAACSFLLGGCVEEMPGAQGTPKTLNEIHGTMSEAVRTKAYLTEGNDVRWEYRDKIGVFSDLTTEFVPFSCYACDENGGDFHAGASITGNTFYAVYPYEETIQVVGDKKISFELNSSQRYEEHSFDSSGCPMVATSTDKEFAFRQTCGLIRIKVKGTMTVSEIILTSNDGTPIAGAGFIDFKEEVPLFRLDENSETLADSISLWSIKQLSEDEETSFYFVLPVMTLEKGFNIRIIDWSQSWLTVTMSTDKPVEIRRAGITTFTTVDTEHLLQQEEDENRATLMALYDAMGGPGWTRQGNWGTDAPLSEWEGVRTDAGGRVYSLNLANNNLTGSIPKEIGDLAQLEFLYLSGNQLTGTLPAEISRLDKLRRIEVGRNRFSGALPAELTSTAWWQKYGWNFVDSSFQFDFDTYNLYIPDFTYQGINSTSFVRGNKYTIYHEWSADVFYANGSPAQVILAAYQRYKNLGLNVLGLCTDADEYREEAYDYMTKYEMEWPVILDADPFLVWNCFGSRRLNVVYLFDENGKLLYYNGLNGDENLMPLLQELLGEGEWYESTDLSADGRYHVLQEATVPNANGIRVVLMGDGFSDRQIQSGLYDMLMRQTMEAFFQQEPFSSHRQYFDVGYVDVVSKHEMVMEGNETALGCYLGSGTTIGGNDETCREYAKSSGLTTDSELNETLIVVLANTVEHHGTCYMYGDYQYTGDYGRGHAVAYFTLEEPGLINVGTAIHEAAGHGFGKLSDEYVSYSMTIPDYRKDDNLRLNENFGWYKNVDYTDDEAAVAWSRFIADERYAGENIGLYQGGDRYAFGIWRPTQNSIMNDNTGEFNAPSREAIYYRIHKLAYGENWVYDPEEFIGWDLSRQRTTTRAVASPTKEAELTAPPVVMTGHWQNGQFVRE